MLVKIVDIHVDDAYYTWRGGLVGKEFNVTGPIYNCGDGWVGGELINLEDNAAYHFHKVKYEPLSS